MPLPSVCSTERKSVSWRFCGAYLLKKAIELELEIHAILDYSEEKAYVNGITLRSPYVIKTDGSFIAKSQTRKTESTALTRLRRSDRVTGGADREPAHTLWFLTETLKRH